MCKVSPAQRSHVATELSRERVPERLESHSETEKTRSCCRVRGVIFQARRQAQAPACLPVRPALALGAVASSVAGGAPRPEAGTLSGC